MASLIVVITVGGWIGRQPDGFARAWDAIMSGQVTDPSKQLARPSNGPPPGLEEEQVRLLPPVSAATTPVAGAFTRTQEGPDGGTVPVAWSPCRPIHYVVNPAGAPVGFADTVAVAMRELSGLTGLVFVDDGVTAEAAVEQRGAYQPNLYGDRWAPVIVQFTDETADPGLAGRVAGMAGVQAVADPTTGLQHFTTGSVHLDVTLLAQPSNGAEAVYLSVLRHELGHLIGLAHVENPTQIMNATAFVETYQEGDLAGLAVLGRGACAPGL
ncbi:matrixin family metalloprotease [Cellulomonas cellasea]|uniref:Peptidase M10 metallopeptidase domain-containing protein n=1 Tax=Cellulomonas cellasea TaxID=43670 RepID=A0A7W4UD22_9CELL|nr:matrixin family metalloprotease [Cellulomonas cellasea]MBB2921288.1 hypothetical protein [Cellulomonas cellasea]